MLKSGKILALCVASGVAGFFISAIFDWKTTSSVVTIDILNTSNSSITKASIEGNSFHQTLTGIKAGNFVQVIIPIKGESDYKLIVELSNGKTISTPGNYFEGGAKIIEVISDEEIHSFFYAKYL